MPSPSRRRPGAVDPTPVPPPTGATDPTPIPPPPAPSTRPPVPPPAGAVDPTPRPAAGRRRRPDRLGTAVQEGPVRPGQIRTAIADWPQGRLRCMAYRHASTTTPGEPRRDAAWP